MARNLSHHTHAILIPRSKTTTTSNLSLSLKGSLLIAPEEEPKNLCAK